MRMPDFSVSHSDLNETVIRFRFTPPFEVQERMRNHGFSYSYIQRTWSKPEMVEEFKVRAIIENWPDD
jgi:hypothetical protein